MIRLAIEALENPQAVGAARERLELPRPGEADDSAEARSLLQASLVFAAPQQTSESDLARLEKVLVDPASSEPSRRLAGEALRSLTATPHAARAVEIAIATLRHADRASHQAAILCLSEAARWARELLVPEALLDLASLEHLKTHRALLNARVLEPALLGSRALRDETLERWLALYDDVHEAGYIRYVQQDRDALPAAARADFLLHSQIVTRLRDVPCRVLMVHNINHGLGDEIILCVPLLQSLLDANPSLEITLVTRRVWLYAHPRLTALSVGDAQRLESVLRGPFDAVIDFVQPFAAASSDSVLEEAVDACVRRSQPFLFLWATNAGNEFVFERVEVAGRSWASALRLDRRRVGSVYDPTFRLIAELGLPLRSGEAVPRSEWVLAGETWDQADSSWRQITAGNGEGRAVALLNPYGGAHSLKGYVDADSVAAEIRRLLAEGYYVVVLANGTSWGTDALTAEALRRLDPEQQERAMAAPLADNDYKMRLTLYWIRHADLVVSVEGWMIHASYCLGKRYRALLLPYSEPEEWTPFAQSETQRAVPSAVERPWLGDAADSVPHLARKRLLLVLLDEIGRAGGEEALPLLRRSLRSPDRHLRIAAARARARHRDLASDELIDLLQDPSRVVRAIAAEALLDLGLSPSPVPIEELAAHVEMGKTPLEWSSVIRMGRAIRPVLEVARTGDEPPLRREAAILLRFFDAEPVRAHRPPTRELLYVSPVVPSVTGGGLAMRAGMVLQTLTEHYRVSLLVVRLYASRETRVPSIFARRCRRTAIVDPTAITEEATGTAPRDRRWGRSRKEPLDELRETSFDVVHVFRLAAVPFARSLLAGHSRPTRFDLDLDDVDSRTHTRLASLHRANGNAARAAIEERWAEQSATAEQEAFREFDRIYVCSDSDRASIADGVRGEVGVLPNAVRPPASATEAPDREPFRFLFVGTLGYYPNEDAVRWLCREIVPRLRARAAKTIEIAVVGGGASRALRNDAAHAGVKLRGPVSGVDRWYRRSFAVLAPIRAGGGTRIKIIEAWSHRRPVVSTSLGAEGLGARDGREILLADDPDLFSDACLRLIDDRDLARRLVASAHDLYRERYSIEAMRSTVASFHRSIVQNGRE